MADPTGAERCHPPIAAPEPILVDRDTAARLLSLAPGTVGAMARSGELPSMKVRGRRLFSLERLREWARERAAEGRTR